VTILWGANILNDINEYIHQLQEIDEELYRIFLKKIEIQPDFQMNCDYNYVLDTDWKYLFLSLFSPERQNGANLGDMIGKHWQYHYFHEQMEMTEQGLQRVLSNGTVIKKETTNQYPGRFGKRHFEHTFTPLYGKNGSIEAVLCTVRDVTGHKDFGRQEWDNFSKLNLLIDISPTAICLIDNNGIFINGNQIFIDIFFPGLTKDDLIGKNADFFKKNTGLDWIKTPCYQVLQGGEIRNFYSRVLGRDLLINAAPIKNQEGSNVGAVAAFNDITKYESLRKEITRLDQLNLIGEMAAGVAHEIRNPLTVIKGFLQHIQTKVNSDIENNIKTILVELKGIELLVSDFLSLARNKQTDFRKQSLNAIIKRIYPLLYTDAIKQGIDVALDLEEELPEMFLDEKEIKQLLLNLARNSIDAMSVRGKVTIATKIRENMISLDISDNGCGIPQDNYQQIFTPFFTTKPDGTGLGLSICASIVERHKGSIQVESKEGIGTRFTITFPVVNNL
jgi:PAS domain S-box-containing protein